MAPRKSAETGVGCFASRRSSSPAFCNPPIEDRHGHCDGSARGDCSNRFSYACRRRRQWVQRAAQGFKDIERPATQARQPASERHDARRYQRAAAAAPTHRRHAQRRSRARPGASSSRLRSSRSKATAIFISFCSMAARMGLRRCRPRDACRRRRVPGKRSSLRGRRSRLDAASRRITGSSSERWPRSTVSAFSTFPTAKSHMRSTSPSYTSHGVQVELRLRRVITGPSAGPDGQRVFSNSRGGNVRETRYAK
jgi:hypothetical protein